MDPIWQAALTDFALLFFASSLAAFGTILFLGKPNTIGSIIGATIRNGAIGAGVSIGFLEVIGARKALAIAIGVGAGVVSERAVWRALLRLVGVSDKDQDHEQKN